MRGEANGRLPPRPSGRGGTPPRTFTPSLTASPHLRQQRRPPPRLLRRLEQRPQRLAARTKIAEIRRVALAAPQQLRQRGRVAGREVARIVRAEQPDRAADVR